MDLQFPTDLKDTPMFNFMNLPTAVAPGIHFNNLKMVKFTNFKKYKNEMTLVWFFINHAVSLENIILVLDHGTDHDFHSLQNEVSLMLSETRQVTLLLDDEGSVRPKHSKICCNIESIWWDFSCFVIITVWSRTIWTCGLLDTVDFLWLSNSCFYSCLLLCYLFAY